MDRDGNKNDASRALAASHYYIIICMGVSPMYLSLRRYSLPPHNLHSHPHSYCNCMSTDVSCLWQHFQSTFQLSSSMFLLREVILADYYAQNLMLYSRVCWLGSLSAAEKSMSSVSTTEKRRSRIARLWYKKIVSKYHTQEEQCAPGTALNMYLVYYTRSSTYLWYISVRAWVPAHHARSQNVSCAKD